MSTDEDLIVTLHSQIDSLQLRVQLLEDQNAKLASQLSNCKCHEIAKSKEEKPRTNKTRLNKLFKQISGVNMGTMIHHPRRYVALKVMYFGPRFYGFSAEAQMDPSIESEIFNALGKAMLLVGDKNESEYSRCGRTDKGVSSVGQVIALFLRSKLKKTYISDTSYEEVVPEEQYEGEIDYVKVINKELPNDIRILGWCPAPAGFSARFTCTGREYKYLFWRDNLNLSAIKIAGQKFVGEHDFRNFCKMDAANVHTYKRNIKTCEISPCSMSFQNNELWSIRLRGSAFLWHQVRCMVAVLFMVGQGLESPDVINTLLDTDMTPRKPQYAMASELPLILHSCEFEGLEFICSADARKAVHVHLEEECRSYQLQAAIFHEALLSDIPIKNAKGQSSLNNGSTKKKASYVPLMLRPTEPSYEERRLKLKPLT